MAFICLTDIVSVPDAPEENVNPDEKEFSPHPYDNDDELDPLSHFDLEGKLYFWTNENDKHPKPQRGQIWFAKLSRVSTWEI